MQGGGGYVYHEWNRDIIIVSEIYVDISQCKGDIASVKKMSIYEIRRLHCKYKIPMNKGDRFKKDAKIRILNVLLTIIIVGFSQMHLGSADFRVWHADMLV